MENKIKFFFHKNWPLMKSTIALLFVMGLLKSLVYIAPLAVNEVLNSINDFGTFEYSLNLGQTLMGVFSMGFSGAYAYFILKQQRENMKSIFHFHFVGLTALLTTVVIVSPELLSNIYYGAVILGVAFADQILLSSISKLSGKNITSVLLDTGIYILMALIVVAVYFQVLEFSLDIWFGSVLFLLIFNSLFYHSRYFLNKNRVVKKDIFDLYRYGGLIVVAGPLLVLITSNTRLYIEYFLTLEDVGVYSYYFRISSVALIFYRVFGILLYRKMFTGDSNVLDKYYSLIITGIFILNILLYLLLPSILKGRDDQFSLTTTDSRLLFKLCFFQVTFWVNVSLFEPILQRENKMKAFIGLLALCLLLFFGTIYALGIFSTISLLNIVWVNTLFIFLLFCGQQWVLWKNNIVYKKSFIIHGLIGILFLFTLFII